MSWYLILSLGFITWTAIIIILPIIFLQVYQYKLTNFDYFILFLIYCTIIITWYFSYQWEINWIFSLTSTNSAGNIERTAWISPIKQSYYISPKLQASIIQTEFPVVGTIKNYDWYLFNNNVNQFVYMRGYANLNSLTPLDYIKYMNTTYPTHQLQHHYPWSTKNISIIVDEYNKAIYNIRTNK